MPSIISSPNQKYKISFDHQGEIPFGPSYYTVRLNGKLISNGLFGYKYLFSENSRFLALELWRVFTKQHAPYCELLLLEIKRKKMALVAEAEGGFFVFEQFSSQYLNFYKEFLGQVTRHGTLKEHRQITIEEVLEKAAWMDWEVPLIQQ